MRRLRLRSWPLLIAALLGAAVVVATPAAAEPIDSVAQRPTQAPSQVTEADKAAILALHTKARAEVGLPALVWDDQYARDAQAWADKLIKANRFDHGTWPPRAPEPGSPGAMKQGENLNAGRPAAEMAEGWYAEKALWERKGRPTSDNWGAFQGVGHYTQMVWDTTTKVGCGTAYLKTYSYERLNVCRYTPGANMWGKQPFGNAVPNRKVEESPVAPVLTATAGATLPPGGASAATSPSAAATSAAVRPTTAAPASSAPASSAPSPSVGACAESAPATADSLRCLIDQERASAKLPPYTRNDSVDGFAQSVATNVRYNLPASGICPGGARDRGTASGTVPAKTAQEAFKAMGGRANELVNSPVGTSLGIAYVRGTYGLLLVKCS